jgi:DNA repair protein RadC
MSLPEIEISIKFKGAKSKLQSIHTYDDIIGVLRKIFNADQMDWCEEMVMICLNNNRKLIGYYKVSKGGMQHTVADPRVIATVALQSAATMVIIAHNHPSGVLMPSTNDKEVTLRIRDGLALLDIQLLDHIIMTSEGYFSFATNKLI